MWSHFHEVLLDLVFPPFCCECGKLGTLLCEKCYQQIEFFLAPTELKLPELYLDSLTVAAHYQPPITSLIHSLKYQSVKDVGKVLGRLLYHCVNFSECDYIAAVPLHASRQHQRGFNQAEIMAKEIALKANIPYYPFLKRTKKTTAQATVKNRSERLTHLENIFAFDKRFESLPRSNQSVLLIDDVVTTGTTLNECAKVLKAAGFEKVHALTVAHGQ